MKWCPRHLITRYSFDGFVISTAPAPSGSPRRRPSIFHPLNFSLISSHCPWVAAFGNQPLTSVKVRSAFSSVIWSSLDVSHVRAQDRWWPQIWCTPTKPPPLLLSNCNPTQNLQSSLLLYKLRKYEISVILSFAVRSHRSHRVLTHLPKLQYGILPC